MSSMTYIPTYSALLPCLATGVIQATASPSPPRSRSPSTYPHLGHAVHLATKPLPWIGTTQAYKSQVSRGRPASYGIFGALRPSADLSSRHFGHCVPHSYRHPGPDNTQHRIGRINMPASQSRQAHPQVSLQISAARPLCGAPHTPQKAIP